MIKKIKKNTKSFIKKSHKTYKLVKSYKKKKFIKKSILKPVVDSKITPEIVKVKKTRRRKKGTSVSKMYFTPETENFIELYNNTECLDTREKIFRDNIKYPFDKLVENVYNTFKFSYFETGPLEVQQETVSHLVANMNKFDKSRGKAFSYFSIVAKHYLIFLNNSNYKRFNQSVEIGEDREENTIQLQTVDKHHKTAELTEFIQLMVKYWETNVGKIFNKQKDLNIANAVIELFRNSDKIDTFNKKALYLYIREISDCRTQQITKIINRMKIFHNIMNKSYIETGSI